MEKACYKFQIIIIIIIIIIINFGTPFPGQFIIIYGKLVPRTGCYN